jgi:hypothetical protein
LTVPITRGPISQASVSPAASFRARPRTTIPSVFLLDTGNPFAARLGKTGSNHPIDANTYRIMALRMSVSSASAQMQFFWNRETMFDNPSSLTVATPPMLLSPGFRVYLFDMTTLPTTVVGPQGFGWGGSVGVLRLDPTNQSGDTVQIDWARLVNIDASLCRTITWTGGNASVDIHLLDGSNNSLGPIARSVASGSASAGCGAPGAGHAFYAGALAPGTYRVAVVNAGAGIAGGNISGGTWVVNDTPTLRFTSPSEEGSSDDFATTVLGNAWDMAAAGDVDYTRYINNPQFTTLNLESEAGVSLGSQPVFMGTSIQGPGVEGFGDPHLGLLWRPGRGDTHRIDPLKYRILTLEMGVPNFSRNINEGSIARIAWRVAGPAAGGESVSDDVIFTSRAGANVLNRIIVDMADRTVLPIEEGDPIGWVRGSSASPGLDLFRIDPHEYTPATPFFIRRVKLAALERTDRFYTIEWAFADAGGTGTVDLYYDNNGSGFDGTLIAANRPTTSSGSYVWDTAGVTLPQAYIYAVFRDSFAGGANDNRAYAKWPIVLTSNAPPSVALDRSSLRFGAVHTGTSFASKTGSQTVRISQSGGGAATFTASSNQPWLVVSPTSGSTPGTLTVSVQHHASVPISGASTGTITLSFSGAEPASAAIAVTLTTTPNGTSAAPVGSFDSPTDGLTGVTGSIALTGWALDDLEVSQVRILRSVTPGVCPTWDPPSLVPIGTATLVEGARPDVAAANPTVPRSTRAGWGYMMLSNFLPSLGNGTFTFCAIADDVEGQSSVLGMKTLTFDNANAAKPFGAIDTPGQGATISGTSYNNFGWVLTRTPDRADPPGGGSVTVFIDGAPVGSPGSWTSRPDLTSLFSAGDYPGIVNAAGVYTFNPQSYAEGVHTIAWSVTENAGATSGIGSRYFTIVGGGAGSVAAGMTSLSLAAPPMMAAAGGDGRLPLGSELRAAHVSTTLQARRGFDLATPFRAAPVVGGQALVNGEELDRFELRLGSPGGALTGYMRAGESLGPLPIGSHLDASSGTFTWQPGVGFVGSYDLVFVRWQDGRAVTRQDVRIVLHPRGSNRVGPQVAIDIPSTHQDVPRRFRVAGWALDLDDAAGPGVETVHVWAYPVDRVSGARLDPLFLGVADHGGARPDVAAVFGERYLRSGFDLTVDHVLEPGTYDIAVFGWSAVRQAFVPARVVRVTVR